MLPVQYTPKHEIVCYDDVIYVIDSNRLDELVKEMESHKFIKVWNWRLAVSAIKRIQEATKEISILEKLLNWETEDIKRKVREKVREREKEHKENSEGAIRNIIESYK